MNTQMLGLFLLFCTNTLSCWTWSNKEHTDFRPCQDLCYKRPEDPMCISKCPQDDRKGMGAIVSGIFGGTGRTDDPDPVTGLTSREKYLVKTSWARIMKEPTDNGVALLSLLFEKHPEYVQLFPFRDVPAAEFSTNARFRAHANSVVYALSSVVDALNENDLLIQLLKKTGTSHIPRKVTADGFLNLKEVTIELFSTIFKPVEVEAWKKTLDVAFGVIIKSLNGEQ